MSNTNTVLSAIEQAIVDFLQDSTEIVTSNDLIQGLGKPMEALKGPVGSLKAAGIIRVVGNGIELVPQAAPAKPAGKLAAAAKAVGGKKVAAPEPEPEPEERLFMVVTANKKNEEEISFADTDEETAREQYQDAADKKGWARLESAVISGGNADDGYEIDSSTISVIDEYTGEEPPAEEPEAEEVVEETEDDDTDGFFGDDEPEEVVEEAPKKAAKPAVAPAKSTKAAPKAEPAKAEPKAAKSTTAKATAPVEAPAESEVDLNLLAELTASELDERIDEARAGVDWLNENDLPFAAEMLQRSIASARKFLAKRVI